MVEMVAFGGWPNCVRLFNGEMEVMVTTDVGPRIVRTAYIEGQNFLYVLPEHMGRSGGDDWRIYGGHRLWHAPEAIPRSYWPDNGKVDYSIHGNKVVLRQDRELSTGLVKEMELEIGSDKNELTVTHRIINDNLWTVELAVWGLSVMAAGGIAVVPQEPYAEGDDYLLPARPLVLWHYTKMNDPRWSWGEKQIRARQDPAHTSEQKIGVLNKQGWVAYELGGDILTKTFSFDPDAVYPDYGCNNEIYINDRFLEIETLSPLTKILPGAGLTHIEHWLLERNSSPAGG